MARRIYRIGNVGPNIKAKTKTLSDGLRKAAATLRRFGKSIKGASGD